MATNRESTTTPSLPVQRTPAAPVLKGDCLLRLSRTPLRYASIPHATLAEKLDELDRVSGDAPMFRDARVRLQTMMLIGWQGDVYQIDDVTVCPIPARVGWPWRCTCGDATCWHAALCEALELVREQQADDGDTALAAKEGAMHVPRLKYRTMLLIWLVSLLILRYMPCPPAQDNAENLRRLGQTVQAMVTR